MTNIIRVFTGMYLFMIAIMGVLFCFRIIHRENIKISQKPFFQISSIVFISTLILVI